MSHIDFIEILLYPISTLLTYSDKLTYYTSYNMDNGHLRTKSFFPLILNLSGFLIICAYVVMLVFLMMFLLMSFIFLFEFYSHAYQCYVYVQRPSHSKRHSKKYGIWSLAFFRTIDIWLTTFMYVQRDNIERDDGRTLGFSSLSTSRAMHLW